jgi:hypothetical protein
MGDNIVKLVRYSQPSKSAIVLLALFTLLLLTTLGVLSFSPLQTITITAAFAQSPSSSLADEIIDETFQDQDSSFDDNVLEDENEFGDEDAAIEQDNTAEQDAANVGAQEQEAAQEAANLDRHCC